MSSSYLVTGGAGFIGSGLVRALLERGDRVRVIDDFSSGRRENLAEVKGRVEVIDASILDAAALARAVSGVEVVYHEAAIPSVPRSLAEPVLVDAVNAGGTLAVLLAAKNAGARRVVFAASCAAYGDGSGSPKVESMPPEPTSPYAASKLAGEHYMQVFARAYGLETVCLRYFNIFGPRQDPKSEYAAVIPRFITAALAGRTPVIYGDGKQSRDFVHLDNCVEANLRAAIAPDASGGIFNIGCGVETDLLQVIQIIGGAIGRPIEARHEPGRIGDIKRSVSDISLARRVLGYTASVSFPEGVRRCIEWYRRQAA